MFTYFITLTITHFTLCNTRTRPSWSHHNDSKNMLTIGVIWHESVILSLWAHSHGMRTYICILIELLFEVEKSRLEYAQPGVCTSIQHHQV